jgi:type II secretory pathway component PulJ
MGIKHMKQPFQTDLDRAQARGGRQAGFTLLEMMMVVFLLTAVLGVLFSISLSITDVSIFQMNKSAASDEARRGIEFLSRQLRNASKSSVSALPAATISFQVARDLDGNGSAVDHSGNLELSPAITVCRDTADANKDGVTTTQLVMKDGTKTTVLANNLLPDEDKNGNGVLDAGEDTNLNGLLDHGVWFEKVGNAVRITLQTKATTRRGNIITSTLVETVLPRN